MFFADEELRYKDRKKVRKECEKSVFLFERKELLYFFPKFPTTNTPTCVFFTTFASLNFNVHDEQKILIHTGNKTENDNQIKNR